MDWMPVTAEHPPDLSVVIVENNGGAVLRRRGNLWFLPDDSMFVYYTPTRWRPVGT